MKWSMMRLIALGRFVNVWYFLFGGSCLVFCGLHALKKIHPKSTPEEVLDVLAKTDID